MPKLCTTDPPTQADLPYLRSGGHAYYQGRVVRIERIRFADPPTRRGVAAVEIEELTEYGTGAGVFATVGPLDLDYAAAHRVDVATVRHALAGTAVERWVARITSDAAHTVVWLSWSSISAAGLTSSEVAEQVAALLRPLWNDCALRVHASIRSVWIDRPGWGWTVPALTPTDAALPGEDLTGEEFVFTDGFPDAPNCVPACGNDSFADGFAPVDQRGVFVDPAPGRGWNTLLFGCVRCGRVGCLGPEPTAWRASTPVLFRAERPPEIPDRFRATA